MSLSTQLPNFKENVHTILEDGLESALYDAIYQSQYKESTEKGMESINSIVELSIKKYAQEFATIAAEEFADNITEKICNEIDTFIKSAVFTGSLVVAGTIVSPMGSCTGTIPIDSASKDTITLI